MKRRFFLKTATAIGLGLTCAKLPAAIPEWEQRLRDTGVLDGMQIHLTETLDLSKFDKYGHQAIRITNCVFTGEGGFDFVKQGKTHVVLNNCIFSMQHGSPVKKQSQLKLPRNWSRLQGGMQW